MRQAKHGIAEAEPIPIAALLTTALDWIEDQVRPGQVAPPHALHRQLQGCEQIAVTALHLLAQGKRVEICGPAEASLLIGGLSLISAASNKPWGFAASPQSWTDQDWEALTNTIAFLRDQPLNYTTGHKQMSIAAGGDMLM